MLQFLDVFFSFLHLALIAFNLFGWIWAKTRKVHLITIVCTAASWFILGIWFGWGYCPITAWQWQIKEKLGETNLPNSFIKYFADKIAGKKFNSSVVDTFTVALFAAATLISVYVNFFNRKQRRVRSKR